MGGSGQGRECKVAGRGEERETGRDGAEESTHAPSQDPVSTAAAAPTCGAAADGEPHAGRTAADEMTRAIA